MAFVKDLDYHMPDLCSCHQITIPLLYDDCITLLQKVNALRAILADFVKSYNDTLYDLDKYLTEIYNRLDSVENQIDTINQKITQVEGDVNSLKTQVQNLQSTINNLRADLTAITNRVGKLESDLTALAARVSALEDAFSKLHIVIPVEMFKENDISWFIENVSKPVLARIHAGGSDSGWEAVGKLFTGDGQPAVTFEAGRLGFNIVRSIMPFIYRYNLGTSVSDAVVKNLCTKFANGFSEGMKGSFIPITLYHETPYSAAAEIEYESGGVLLLGTSSEASVITKPKILIRQDTNLQDNGTASYSFVPSASVRTAVRWQIPAPGSKAAGLLISAEHNSPVFYIVKEGSTYYLYATMFAEHN